MYLERSPVMTRIRGLKWAWLLLVVALLPACVPTQAYLRCDFEDGKIAGWSAGRAHVNGKDVGAMPSLRVTSAPKEPTFGGSRHALLLDDPVGDSVEICASVRFRPVKVTENTRVSLCYRWESQSGEGGVNVRVPTAGTLKYHNLIAGKPGEWQCATLNLVDFKRDQTPVRPGDSFDGFTVRLFSTKTGWRKLWIDNVVVYEGPDAQPPTTVSGLAYTQRGARIVLSWRPAEDDTAVISYALHRGNRPDFTPGEETLLGVTQEPRSEDVVCGKRPYFYRVIASDFGGNSSPPSPPVSATPKLSPLPAPRLAAPPDAFCAILGEEVLLRWDSVPGAERYLVQCLRGPGFAGGLVRESAQTQLALKDLEPGPCWWRVMAVDAGGLGSAFSTLRSLAVRRYYETVKPAPHPRLCFEAADVPKMRAAAQVEPTKTFWERIKKDADRCLEDPPVQYVPAERWGTFLITTRRANDRIETLTFVYLLTNDRRYLDKAKEQVKVVLSWECWVDPCHGVSSRADLATGEICRGLGEFYDWAYDALSEQERREVRSVLVNRGIIPVYERSVEGAFWARHFNNWAAVVQGGAGVAALALLGEEPDAPIWLDQMEAKIRCFLDAYDAQGGWVEGPGYWCYGTSYALWFIDALRRVTHGGRDLYRHERLAKTLNFVLYCTTPDFGGTINFADSWYGPFMPFLVRRLSAEYRNPYGAWYLAHREGGGLWDFLWRAGLPPARTPAAEEPPPAILFPDINWAVLRQGWTDPRDCFFAIKGGTNADPHGHRDMAGFILNAFGKRLLIDQGGGMYRKEYWKGDDYEVVSAGHNTLLLDGEGQQRRAEDDAHITEFFHSPAYDYVLCDASRAYGDRLERFLRRVVYLRPDTFVLFDDVAAPKPVKIESLLHTFGAITRDGDVLKFEDGDVALLARAVLPPDFADQIGKGAPQREQMADQFIRWGPVAPVRQVRFLVAMRPLLRRELPKGMAVWEDFEDSKADRWAPSCASVKGKPDGALPQIKVAAPEPTYEQGKSALLLDDPVGDSAEANANLRLPQITVTPNTRISFACRWESESGKGHVNMRINADRLLKYFDPKEVPGKQWIRLSAKATEFRRGDVPTRAGEQFDSLCIRLTGTGKGWRKLWLDNVTVYEGPDAVPEPPKVLQLVPDEQLACRAVGGTQCTGVRLRRGDAGEDLVLFRGQGDIAMDDVRTDAKVCVVSLGADQKVSKFLACQATRLDSRGAPLLRCPGPASVSLELSATGARGVVEAAQDMRIEVFLGGKPSHVDVRKGCNPVEATP
jgi:hypothetical protein